MVQPIEYTPQFIKTDVGAIQDKLNARQGQYDTAYAGALGAEDQFGQMPVYAKDIDLKNKVIGGFKDRVKSLVDQYGGDYAAASKQLVKEIVNTKNDKFFETAALRNKLAEEQRKRTDALGINARVINDVTKPDLYDEKTGRYIDADQLKSKVIDMGQYMKYYDDIINDLKTAKNESGLQQSNRTGILENITRLGINPNDVPKISDVMYQKAIQMDPDVANDPNLNAELKQMANIYAMRGVQGVSRTNMIDPAWEANQRKVEYDRTHPQTPPGGLNGLPMSSQSYFDVTDESTKIKGLKSRLMTSKGDALAAVFGEKGNINPLKLYEDVNKYKKESINLHNEEIAQLYNKYSLNPRIKLTKLDNGQLVISEKIGDSTIPLTGSLLKEYQALQKSQRYEDYKYNNMKTISDDDYNYLKELGISNNETSKTIIPKINKYEQTSSARYNRYDIGVTDYQYVTDQLAKQIPSNNSSVTNIIQPLDKNLKPISGSGSLSGRTWSPDSFKFTKDFIDSDGKTKLKSIEFVPSVGLIATNTDGKLFKLGKGAIKDQLNFITDDTGDREVIEYYIKNGDYDNANKAINMSISNAVPMITNSQVAPNPIKLKND